MWWPGATSVKWYAALHAVVISQEQEGSIDLFALVSWALFIEQEISIRPSTRQDGCRWEPFDLCCGHPRQHLVVPGYSGAGADLLPCVQEEVDGVVSVSSLRDGAAERNAVALLRAAHKGPPPPHHQHRWVRRRDRLPRHLPRLRAQASQGLHRQARVHHERGAVRGHGLRPAAVGEGRREPRHHRRRHRVRLRSRRFRRPSRHHQASDQDQERGVPALLAILLSHHQRCRLVLLRPTHERFLRSDTQRAGVAVRAGPDGAAPGVQEPQEEGRRVGGPGPGRRREEPAATSAAAAGRHNGTRRFADHRRRRGGSERQGGRRRRQQAAERVRGGHRAATPRGAPYSAAARPPCATAAHEDGRRGGLIDLPSCVREHTDLTICSMVCLSNAGAPPCMQAYVYVLCWLYM